MRWSRIAIVLLSLLLVVSLLMLLAASHREVLDSAERQAVLRVLGEFHCQFVQDSGLPLDKYLQRLRGFQQKYRSFRDVNQYVTIVEEIAEDAKQLKPKHPASENGR